MKISDLERAELHSMLDYLLMTREGLERINPAELSPGMQYSSAWSLPRVEFMANGSKFLRRLLGDKLLRAELATLNDTDLEEGTLGGDNLATLANALRSFQPLFESVEKEDEDKEFIRKIIDDFMGVYWGDEPRFFSISQRSQGMHKRPFRLAYLRLRALEWEKYLEVVGLTAFERQMIVSTAFRTRWDSIRKWKISIAEQFDLVPWPPRYPDLARLEYEQGPDEVRSKIANDGNAYWLEKSSAKSGKES